MTKKMLLALAITLGTLTVATPPAFACGGYGVVDPEVAAVEAAAARYYTSRIGSNEHPYFVYGVELRSPRRATATLQFTRGDDFIQRTLYLRRGARGWHVIGSRALRSA